MLAKAKNTAKFVVARLAASDFGFQRIASLALIERSLRSGQAMFHNPHLMDWDQWEIPLSLCIQGTCQALVLNPAIKEQGIKNHVSGN
jgi:hypothetical protein